MNVTFLGGCTYGIEDLNNAVAKLVGTGVAPFTAKDSYDYEDLNSLTSSVTAQGVSLGGLKVEADGNIITINKGIAYFENGVTVEFQEPEEFVYSAGIVYVFLKYDVALRTPSIEVSESDYDSNDTYNYYIPLAIVNGNNVTDRRIFARSKVATFGANVAEKRQFELLDEPIPIYYLYNNYSVIDYSKDNLLNQGYLESSIRESKVRGMVRDIELSKYNYVICVQTRDYDGAVYALKEDYFLFQGTRRNTNTIYTSGEGFEVGTVNGQLLAMSDRKVDKDSVNRIRDLEMYFV